MTHRTVDLTEDAGRARVIAAPPHRPIAAESAPARGAAGDS